MPDGICKLCLEEKELQDSHLYPRSLYKALRNEDGGNPNPVLLTTEKLVQKSGRHAVEVAASTLYEATTLALAEFRRWHRGSLDDLVKIDRI